MKKTILFVVVMMCVAVLAYAADFIPIQMSITAPEQVSYPFDGSELQIPITVTGTPANTIFCVFTRGKALEIGTVQNGFLGWHYVNNIDTCIFVSSAVKYAIGDDVIKWNGQDSDGGVVPEGDYTFYVWAYDNESPKTPAATVMSFGWNDMSIVQTHDADMNPLGSPVIWSGGGSASGTDDTVKTHRKWTLGNDPADATLIETCAVLAAADLGSLALDTSDYSMFWKADQTAAGTVEVTKYKWVPNGDGEIQTDWGEDGIVAFALPENSPSGELHMPLSNATGATDIFVVNHNYITGAAISELIYIDMDEGFENTRVDLADWWVRIDEGGDAGGQAGGGPSDVIDAHGGLLHLSAHGSCVNQLLDPYRDGDAGGDINDLTLWVNQNGDYIGDHNFEETATRPWICNDFNVGPYKYWTTTDANGFAAFPVYDMGAVSFGLFAPDGTGIDHLAFAGETASAKYRQEFIDYGSAFDGMYTDGNSTGQGRNWLYIAHDSVSGLLTSEVGVADDAPAAFSVDQNLPNPFNPTTTINFSLLEAGKVSVDIFNVAGQKVDTLVNGHLDSGSHSVVWDASDFSAGVYFYTVKSSDFSKTMKMTLVK